MPNAPALVVLAAGLGSRYGGLKQIDPIGPTGEVLLDYAVFDALRAGFGELVFVIRPELEADLKARLQQRFAGVPMTFVYQDVEDLPDGFNCPAGRTKPWGTGHAVLAGRDTVTVPFCVINADDFYGLESFQRMAGFLRDCDPAGTAFSMVGFNLRNTLSANGHVSRGICSVNPEGFLTTVVERLKIEPAATGARFPEPETGAWHELTGDEVVSMNFWGFTPAFFPALQTAFRDFLQARGDELKSEFYIPSVVDDMVSADAASVRVLHSDDRWFGVTYPGDKAAVTAAIANLIEQGTYPAELAWPLSS